MKKDVTITYLQMLDPAWLKAKPCPEPLLEIKECVERQAEQSRSLYEAVGKDWNWTDRLSWDQQQWATYAECQNTRTWIAFQGKQIAGYFELLKDGGDVEIKYFGLMAGFIGKGYGRYLLTEAIRQGWAWEASRVWVHTCTLDHPNAIDNYLARGMRIYKKETVVKNV